MPIDIEAELRALGKRIRREIEEWCDSPEGRAQNERLMARIFGAAEAEEPTMKTTKTVTARAWFDKTQSPAAWAVRYTATEDASEQLDELLAEDLAAGANSADVTRAVESHCRSLGWTLAGVEVY
jgi:hypothetical protein